LVSRLETAGGNADVRHRPKNTSNHRLLVMSLVLTIGIAALASNGRPALTTGDQLLKAIRYGQIIHPILFASVVARLIKALALRRSEKGSPLGVGLTHKYDSSLSISRQTELIIRSSSSLLRAKAWLVLWRDLGCFAPSELSVLLSCYFGSYRRLEVLPSPFQD